MLPAISLSLSDTVVFISSRTWDNALISSATTCSSRDKLAFVTESPFLKSAFNCNNCSAWAFWSLAITFWLLIILALVLTRCSTSKAIPDVVFAEVSAMLSKLACSSWKTSAIDCAVLLTTVLRVLICDCSCLSPSSNWPCSNVPICCIAWSRVIRLLLTVSMLPESTLSPATIWPSRVSLMVWVELSRSTTLCLTVSNLPSSTLSPATIWPSRVSLITWVELSRSTTLCLTVSNFPSSTLSPATIWPSRVSLMVLVLDVRLTTDCLTVSILPFNKVSPATISPDNFSLMVWVELSRSTTLCLTVSNLPSSTLSPATIWPSRVSLMVWVELSRSTTLCLTVSNLPSSTLSPATISPDKVSDTVCTVSSNVETVSDTSVILPLNAMSLSLIAEVSSCFTWANDFSWLAIAVFISLICDSVTVPLLSNSARISSIVWAKAPVLSTKTFWPLLISASPVIRFCTSLSSPVEVLAEVSATTSNWAMMAWNISANELSESVTTLFNSVMLASFSPTWADNSLSVCAKASSVVATTSANSFKAEDNVLSPSVTLADRLSIRWAKAVSAVVSVLTASVNEAFTSPKSVSTLDVSWSTRWESAWSAVTAASLTEVIRAANLPVSVSKLAPKSEISLANAACSVALVSLTLLISALAASTLDVKLPIWVAVLSSNVVTVLDSSEIEPLFSPTCEVSWLNCSVDDWLCVTTVSLSDVISALLSPIVPTIVSSCWFVAVWPSLTVLDSSDIELLTSPTSVFSSVKRWAVASFSVATTLDRSDNPAVSFVSTPSKETDKLLFCSASDSISEVLAINVFSAAASRLPCSFTRADSALLVNWPLTASISWPTSLILVVLPCTDSTDAFVEIVPSAADKRCSTSVSVLPWASTTSFEALSSRVASTPSRRIPTFLNSWRISVFKTFNASRVMLPVSGSILMIESLKSIYSA